MAMMQDPEKRDLTGVEESSNVNNISRIALMAPIAAIAIASGVLARVWLDERRAEVSEETVSLVDCANGPVSGRDWIEVEAGDSFTVDGRRIISSGHGGFEIETSDLQGERYSVFQDKLHRAENVYEPPAEASLDIIVGSDVIRHGIVYMLGDETAISVFGKELPDGGTNLSVMQTCLPDH